MAKDKNEETPNPAGVSNPVPSGKKSKVGSYTAFAPFEIFVAGDTVKYKAGDSFSPPTGWERDPAFDAFRGSEKRNSEHPGITFVYFAGFTGNDPKKGEKIYNRMTLPVDEV